jgi:hypothetical protein
MKINPTIGLAVALGLTAFTFSVSTASAAIVCNDDGDCWHVKNKYTYPPSVQLHVYGDEGRHQRRRPSHCNAEIRCADRDRG